MPLQIEHASIDISKLRPMTELLKSRAQLDDMFVEGKPGFWKTNKQGDVTRQRTSLEVAFHGTSMKEALKMGGTFRKGTHVTSSLLNAVYWSVSTATGDSSDAVIFRLSVRGVKLLPGDQQDNPDHALIGAPVKAVPVYYTTLALARSLMSMI